MKKPRKKWMPEYRFGGNPSDRVLPNVLGENKLYLRPKKVAKRGRK